MKLKALIIALISMLGATVLAQDYEALKKYDVLIADSKQYNKWSTSKNFMKGIEAIGNEDYEDAVKAFQTETKQHPSNGYAICNLAQCQFLVAREMMINVLYDDESNEQEQELAQKTAFENMKAAIPLFDKGLALLPTKDNESLCQAYCAKAAMLLNLDDVDSTQVAQCYDKAIALHPCKGAYEQHMNFCSDTETIIADILALRKLYPDDREYIKLLAIMAYRDDKPSQCLQLCDEHDAMLRSQGEEGVDTQIATLRLLSLKDLDREEEAMNLALDFTEKYEINEAMQIFMLLAEKNPDLAEIKIKQRIFADYGDNMLWNSMLGRIMENKKDYASALNYLKIVEPTEHEAYLYNEIAKCYYMLGDTQNALTYIEAATIMSGGDEYLPARDEMLVNMGMASKIIDEKMTGVELIKNIDETETAQRLTLAELLIQQHDYQQAASILQPVLKESQPARALSLYAAALEGLGRNSEAREQLQLIADIDSVVEPIYLIPALHELGQTDKAEKQAEEMVAKWMLNQAEPSDESSAESCYDIAVIHALIGDNDTALDFLEKHFSFDDMPYNFGYIDRDWRLDSLRELPQFKSLVENYKTQWKNNSKTIIKQ